MLKIQCPLCKRQNYNDTVKFILNDAYVVGQIIYAECEDCLGAREDMLNEHLASVLAETIGD